MPEWNSMASRPTTAYRILSCAILTIGLPSEAPEQSCEELKSAITTTAASSLGFYPDFADTSKKPDNGQKECLCRREENTVPSSSMVRLNKRDKRALVVPRLLMNWASPRTC